jgi:hypothetical protein
MTFKINFEDGGDILSIDSRRGDRHTRTKLVRIKRAQKKIHLNVERREGVGAFAPNIRAPKGVRISVPTQPGWREKKLNVSEMLAHAA